MHFTFIEPRLIYKWIYMNNKKDAKIRSAHNLIEKTHNLKKIILI